jgi:hypothetical protein
MNGRKVYGLVLALADAPASDDQTVLQQGILLAIINKSDCAKLMAISPDCALRAFGAATSRHRVFLNDHKPKK